MRRSCMGLFNALALRSPKKPPLRRPRTGLYINRPPSSNALPFPLSNRPMPTLRTALLLLCALLAGCLPESRNPIASPRDSFLDTRLEGAWATRDGKGPFDYYHFQHEKAAPWIRIVGVAHDETKGLGVVTYDALSARIGSQTYLSFRALSEDGTAVHRRFSFARYDFDWLGRLRIYPLVSESQLADAVRSGRLRGTVKGKRSSETVKLTDTSARIAAFIAAPDAKGLFNDEPMVMRRVR